MLECYAEVILALLIVKLQFLNVPIERCDVEDEIRLVKGNNPLEGQVEICKQSTWATVCNTLWNTAEARVVCRQLGYSSDGEHNFGFN